MTAELKASRNDATLILTFANPGQRNAVDSNVLAAAIETLSKAERDDSVRALVLNGASVDLLFCHQTFHHLVEQEQALAEFYRVLKPGGNLSYRQTLAPPSCSSRQASCTPGRA